MNKIVTVLVLGFFLSMPSLGDDPKKKQDETKTDAKKEESKVISNEDLKKRYGDPERPVPPPPSGLPAQPRPVPEAGEAADAETKAGEVRDKAIKALNDEKSHLEGRIRSIKNPFLRKVEPTRDEQKAEKGKGAAERVGMLEQRLRKVEADLKKLKAPARKK